MNELKKKSDEILYPYVDMYVHNSIATRLTRHSSKLEETDNSCYLCFYMYEYVYVCDATSNLELVATRCWLNFEGSQQLIVI